MKAEKLESRYFTESYQMIEDIWNKIMSEETEGEPLSDKEKIEAASIMKRVQEEKTQVQNMPDPEKNQQFDRLAKMAQILAERCLLDVFIEKTENQMGIIRFQANHFFITQEMPVDMKYILASLVASSSSLSISPLVDEKKSFHTDILTGRPDIKLIEIELIFHLFNESQENNSR